MFISNPIAENNQQQVTSLKTQPSLYDKDKNNNTGFNDTAPHH